MHNNHKEENESIFSFELPKTACVYSNMIAIELNTMFPQNSTAVSAVLPVLIFCYIYKAKYFSIDLDQDGFPNMPSSDLKGTCSLYNELVMGPDSGYSVSKEQKVKEFLKKVKKLFYIPHWTSTYSKLSLNKLLSEQSSPQRRQILGKIFLFLTLTYELRDICNITLSLHAFEYMTGYLSMIATNFPMGNNPLPEPISFSTDYFRKECLEQIESLDVRTVDDSRAIELYLKFNFLLRREFWYRDYFKEVQISNITEKIEIDDYSWALITNDLYGIEHIIHLEEERYNNP